MKNNEQQPYIITERVITEYSYNPEYGDNRICKCGHEYNRHFDSWEDMQPVGCKYCHCSTFEELPAGAKSIAEAGDQGYEDGKAGRVYNNPYSKSGEDAEWFDAYDRFYNYGQDSKKHDR